MRNATEDRTRSLRDRMLGWLETGHVGETFADAELTRVADELIAERRAVRVTFPEHDGATALVACSPYDPPASPECVTNEPVKYLTSRFYPVHIDNRRIYNDPKRREMAASLDYPVKSVIGIKGARLNRFPCYRTFDVLPPVRATPGVCVHRFAITGDGHVLCDKCREDLTDHPDTPPSLRTAALNGGA